MILIESEYAVGDTVYLKTDSEQLKRVITGISIRPKDICYSVSQGVNSSWHYDFEMSKTKDADIVLNIPVKNSGDA